MPSTEAPITLGRRLTRSQDWLDQIAERLQPPVGTAVRSRPWLHNLLDGTWLGTPLHPALTDVPVGAWTAAFALDAVSSLTRSPGARTAADSALAVGVAGAVPAALTGASERCLDPDRAQLLSIVVHTPLASARSEVLPQVASGLLGDCLALLVPGMQPPTSLSAGRTVRT